MRLVPRVIKINVPSLKSNSGEPGMFFTDRNLRGGLTYRSKK